MAKEFHTGIEVDGDVVINDSTGATALTLGGDGFGGSRIQFADPDSGEEGEIFYDPSLNLMRFTVGAETALELEEDEVHIFVEGHSIARFLWDSGGHGDLVMVGDGSFDVGRLRATADNIFIIASDSAIKLRPSGILSTAREMVLTASGPTIRDSGGTLRDLAFVHSSGTFTPAIKGTSSNPSVTYSSRGGYYRRIGDLVFVSGVIIASGYVGGGGNLLVGDLPFNCVNSGFARATLAVNLSTITFPTSRTSVAGMMQQNDNSFALYGSGSGNSLAVFPLSSVPIGFTSQIWFAGCYVTGDA